MAIVSFIPSQYYVLRYQEKIPNLDVTKVRSSEEILHSQDYVTSVFADQKNPL
jgi:hypothetical protein